MSSSEEITPEWLRQRASEFGCRVTVQIYRHADLIPNYWEPIVQHFQTRSDFSCPYLEGSLRPNDSKRKGNMVGEEEQTCKRHRTT
jgi:hypothetical protein